MERWNSLNIKVNSKIHFIEIPKLDDASDEKDLLVAWTQFLKNPESEKVRSLERSIEEIREAKDELHRLSADQRQRQRYEMRAKKIRDEVSALNKAKKDGIQQVAVSLLDILDDETIAIKTGLTLDEVEVLRK